MSNKNAEKLGHIHRYQNSKFTIGNIFSTVALDVVKHFLVDSVKLFGAFKFRYPID